MITTLMLVIDISLKETLGYIEENRISYARLLEDPIYQARKEFANDKNLRKI